jgi:Fe-S cluster assembly iron-binding protein IscA
MTKIFKSFVLILISGILICSCGQPRLLLKEKVAIDTLRIHLATNTIQQFEYKLAIERKAAHYTEVFNKEEHPFYLKLVTDPAIADCELDFLKTKFVSKKRSKWATVISSAGIATATILLTTNFFLPVGWLYIPNARTTLRASLSPDLTELKEFPSITILSSGMYRKYEKQVDLQSTKVVKYLIEMVRHIENEYKANKGITTQ